MIQITQNEIAVEFTRIVAVPNKNGTKIYYYKQRDVYDHELKRSAVINLGRATKEEYEEYLSKRGNEK